MSKPITALLFGAGSRGADAYGPYVMLHPEEIQFVGVAEPVTARRERFAKMHNIPEEDCGCGHQLHPGLYALSIRHGSPEIGL